MRLYMFWTCERIVSSYYAESMQISYNIFAMCSIDPFTAHGVASCAQMIRSKPFCRQHSTKMKSWSGAVCCGFAHENNITSASWQTILHLPLGRRYCGRSLLRILQRTLRMKPVLQRQPYGRIYGDILNLWQMVL